MWSILCFIGWALVWYDEPVPHQHYTLVSSSPRHSSLKSHLVGRFSVLVPRLACKIAISLIPRQRSNKNRPLNPYPDTWGTHIHTFCHPQIRHDICCLFQDFEAFFVGRGLATDKLLMLHKKLILISFPFLRTSPAPLHPHPILPPKQHGIGNRNPWSGRTLPVCFHSLLPPPPGFWRGIHIWSINFACQKKNRDIIAVPPAVVVTPPVRKWDYGKYAIFTFTVCYDIDLCHGAFRYIPGQRRLRLVCLFGLFFFLLLK